MVSFITEKQFNMLHDLLNLCDEKQIPREMQYIIVKNLQSSLYMERDIEEIKNEVLSESVPFAKDKPFKICLFTDGVVYGPMPEENEPLLQRISLTDKGNVTVTFYNYEKKKLGMKKFRVDAERALAVIRDIAYHFACEQAHLRAYDVGSWDLTVTTDRGEKYDFCGDLLEDAVQNILSDKLRDLLNDPALLCFDGRDGKKRKYRICFCRFESGDKEYSYRSDNPDMHIGDAVIVPVGNYGRTAFATVTNIEYMDEDELALPLDEIKFIERALTLADSTGKGNVTLFDIVKRAVDATDCEGFLETGCPADEYDGESRLITQRIAPHMDKYQIATIMAEVMTNQMGTPYPSNMFYNAAEYIIKAITDKPKSEECKVVGTSEKSLDGLFIMERFMTDTDPSKEKKDRGQTQRKNSNNMTDMQKQMYAARGHNVEVHLVGRYKPLIGKCIGYTQPLDNDPEVASIDIRVPGYTSIYEIAEPEIESITIL